MYVHHFLFVAMCIKDTTTIVLYGVDPRYTVRRTGNREAYGLRGEASYYHAWTASRREGPRTFEFSTYVGIASGALVVRLAVPEPRPPGSIEPAGTADPAAAAAANAAAWTAPSSVCSATPSSLPSPSATAIAHCSLALLLAPAAAAAATAAGLSVAVASTAAPPVLVPEPFATAGGASSCWGCVCAFASSTPPSMTLTASGTAATAGCMHDAAANTDIDAAVTPGSKCTAPLDDDGAAAAATAPLPPPARPTPGGCAGGRGGVELSWPLTMPLPVGWCNGTAGCAHVCWDWWWWWWWWYDGGRW
ncbi:hypothetical protein Vafri_6526 [Volvox africanus]|uniref:Uncharacterized protein n=1 Tax=Volvox africanus TaxID=51714 RepID=A0A8J4AYK0_9CHLO|nr:hypothetical protein Vafri_6526 [Volvox africanus]